MKFDKDFFKYFALLGNLGFIIVGNILVSIIIYKYVVAKYICDNPIIFILFVILGVVSGFYSVYKNITKK